MALKRPLVQFRSELASGGPFIRLMALNALSFTVAANMTLWDSNDHCFGFASHASERCGASMAAGLLSEAASRCAIC